MLSNIDLSNEFFCTASVLCARPLPPVAFNSRDTGVVLATVVDPHNNKRGMQTAVTTATVVAATVVSAPDGGSGAANGGRMRGSFGAGKSTSQPVHLRCYSDGGSSHGSNSRGGSVGEVDLGRPPVPPLPVMATVLSPADHSVVRCICGVNLDTGFMICCDVCDLWQHGACVGYPDERAAPPTYVCPRCCDRQAQRPRSITAVNLPPDSVAAAHTTEPSPLSRPGVLGPGGRIVPPPLAAAVQTLVAVAPTTTAAGAAGQPGCGTGGSMHQRPKVEIPATPLCVDHRIPLEFMCGPCQRYICSSCFTGHASHRHHAPIFRLADRIHQMVHAMTPGLIELEIKTLSSVQYLEAQAAAYQQQVQDWSQAAHRMLSMLQMLYGSDDFPSVPRVNGLMQLNQELQNIQQYLPPAPSLPTLPVAPTMSLAAAPHATTASTKPQMAAMVAIPPGLQLSPDPSSGAFTAPPQTAPVMAPLTTLPPSCVTIF
jgi:hypothetical protein